MEGDRVVGNARPHLRTLTAAYQATGKAEYAQALARLFGEWYASRPRPQHREYLQWRTLETGNRCVYTWALILAVAAASDAFAADVFVKLALPDGQVPRLSDFDPHRRRGDQRWGKPTDSYPWASVPRVRTQPLCDWPLRHHRASANIPGLTWK